MQSTRLIPLALGVPATISTLATSGLTILFSSNLLGNHLPQAILAIVASCLNIVSLAFLLLIITRHVLEKDVRVNQTALVRRLPECSAAALFLAFGTTLTTLIWIYMTLTSIKSRIGKAPTGSLVLVAFIVCGLSFLGQLTIIGMIWSNSRSTQLKARAYSGTWEPSSHQEMRTAAQKSVSQSGTAASSTNTDGESEKVVSPDTYSTKRVSSDTTNSIQSSLAQSVRPITSKTRLLGRSQTISSRPESSASHQYSIASEEGFDSWDTSTVDSQYRQALMRHGSSGHSPAMPTTSRFLETIPASPTTSRSPSPGYPLDQFEPPFGRRRSRSESPASFRSGSRRERTASPAGNEAHIHPLFRSDSPTPPPSVTPGTVVTAAPGAGVLISDRASIRSLKRMRSGSLPTSPSPLANSNSFENMAGRFVVESTRMESPESIVEEVQEESERPLTPPIPGWILDSGRNSMLAYEKRKEDNAVVGEAISC